MNIEVKLFSILARYLPPEADGRRVRLTVPEGTTVAQVLDQLGVPRQLAKLIVIDGVVHQKADMVLRAGNVLSVFPPIAGGKEAMITITFNAFSFLRPKLKSIGIDYSNARVEIPEGITVEELIEKIGLEQEEVEAVFVNGKVVLTDSILQNDDRVGLVPPGTPGPYRVLLGIFKPEKSG